MHKEAEQFPLGGVHAGSMVAAAAQAVFMRVKSLAAPALKNIVFFYT